MAEPAQAVEFLTALWGGPKMPDGLLVALWVHHAAHPGTGKRASSIFAVNHWKGVEASVITNQRHDVYVHAAGLDKKPPGGKRGTAATAAAIPGVWLDVDCDGGPEGRTGTAPDRDAALELVHRIAPPSIIVDSGYGVHAWWRFPEPWVFADDSQRAEAGALTAGWVEAHRRLVDWKIDGVGDLARVMRLPGTLNHKAGAQAPVSLISTTGEAIPLAAVAEQAAAHTAAARTTPRATAAASAADQLADLPSDTDVPREALLATFEADLWFFRIWKRERTPKTKTWSDSEFDLSIITTLLNSGMAIPAAVACTIESRRKYGDPEKGEKLERLDYWRRTVARALNGRETVAAKEAEAEFAEQLAEVAAEAPAVGASAQGDATKRWAIFNKALGLTGDKRGVSWRQYGADPETARQVLVLANGTEVPLGTMMGLMNQPKTRAAMAVAGRVPFRNTKQAIWIDAWNAVLPLRVDEEQSEDERANLALHWIADAIERGGVESDAAHFDGAIREHRPILRDGRVYITTKHLGRHLRVAEGRRDVRDTDLPPLLAAAGLEVGKLSYTKAEADGGKRSSASYWSIEAEALP